MNSTILVADSDNSICTLIRDILSMKGYRVETVGSVAAASSFMEKQEPDMVFAPKDLDDGGVVDLMREAERIGLRIPLILMVDASSDDPASAVQGFGALNYLKKPVDRSRLLMAVRHGEEAKRRIEQVASFSEASKSLTACLKTMTTVENGATFVLDDDGVVLECGGMTELLIGVPPEDAKACPYLSLLSDFSAGLHGGTISKARATMAPARMEEHRSGAVIETVVNPVGVDGALTGFVVRLRDITTERRGEAGLAQSEKQYRSVFEGASVSIVLIDQADGKLITANKAALRALGVTAEDVSRLSIKDIVVRYESVMQSISKRLDRVAYEYLRRMDGTSFPVELSLSYFANAGREVCILYAQDVSKRKIVEEALREGARLYRAVVEDQTELICRYSPDGKLTFVNGAYARFFGEDEDEVLGKDCSIHLGSVDRRSLSEWLERADAAHPVHDSEVRQIRADGELRWIHWTNRAVFNERQAVIEIQAVGRDITDRKDAERARDEATIEKEQYRLNLVATFKSIPDAILTVDTDLVVMASNKAAADLFGYEKGRMRGQFLEKVVTGDGNPCVSVLKQVLKTDKPVRGYEIELETPTLGERMVEINCSPLVGQDKKHTGAVLVVRDVSHVADLEKKLQQRSGFRGIIGSSGPMQGIYELLEQLSSLESIVLILGESGTGKELVAEALHYGGVRAGKPLIKVNCSALSESLLESELFGHVKGAFTGAVRDKVGRIQAAQGGTLFLDEIGDISPLLQLKLLRFLEQKEYERVGDTKTLSADVRIIAATNVNLREAVRQGTFREDLYYRLNVMPVTLPSLRERQADIPLLVDHFLALFGDQFGKSFAGVSEDVMDLFMSYRWPGNVRELRHALEHACILAPGNTISLKHIRKDLIEQAQAKPIYAPADAAHQAAPKHFVPPVVPRKPGKDDILAALAACGGNKVQAARQLGIHRATLYRKLKAWGVEV